MRLLNLAACAVATERLVWAAPGEESKAWNFNQWRQHIPAQGAVPPFSRCLLQEEP